MSIISSQTASVSSPAGREVDDAGIRRNDVDVAEFGDTLVDDRLEFLEIADINLSVTIRRSSASTNSAVSARSAALAMEYLAESTGLQMSIATMSAPSCASRTA